MSYEMLETPIELTDAELDFVAAGARPEQNGLINVSVDENEVLNRSINNNNISINVIGRSRQEQ